MTEKKCWQLFGIILFLVSGILHLASEVSALEVKPGGLLFAHYEFVTSQHLQNGATAQNFNAFEVSRIYLNADAKFDEAGKYAAFIQLEANLTSRDNKANRVYLKNAELRFKFNKAANLSFGMVSVPWRGYEEKFWKHRFVSKILDDIEGLLPASDRGIRFSGEVPFLSYDAMISNGEGTGGDGTGGNESTTVGAGGRLKDYAIKLAVAPLETVSDELKGLKLNLLLHKGSVNENQLRDRYYAGISYESKMVNAMWTYYNADNGKTTAPSRGEGFSAHTVIAPIEKVWGFLRYDKYDPDLHTGNDAKMRYLWGIGFQVTKGVRISFDHQYLQREVRTTTAQDESIFFLHTEAKF